MTSFFINFSENIKMYNVEGKFPHYSSHDNKGSFALKCDKSMNPFTWAPPIQWTGYVNNIKVDFVQISSGAYGRSSFDFTNFPQEFDSAIPYMIEAIDKAMRVMD